MAEDNGKKNGANGEGDDDTGTPQRSPAYPSIALGDAVQKVKDLYKKDKGASGGLDVLAKHWETTAKSSGFLQTVGTLKRYGLLDELEGKPRRFKLSKLSLDIVILPPTDPKHIAALKRAAVAPVAFKELWDQYKTDLPSDENLQHYL